IRQYTPLPYTTLFRSVSKNKDAASALMLKPAVGVCASDTATPLTAAKTPVMVNTVVKSRPQVERRLRYFGATSGWSCLFSHFQNTAKKIRPITTPTMTMNQLAAPALPDSLTAKVME